MTARNNYISSIAKKAHKAHFGGRELSVFCVSNTVYKDCRPEARKDSLSIKGSGIPALRKHFHKVPARAQYRVANHYLTVQLKHLVEQVQLWLIGGSPGSLPNDRTVQKMLDDLRDTLKVVLYCFLLERKMLKLNRILGCSFKIQNKSKS